VIDEDTMQTLVAAVGFRSSVLEAMTGVRIPVGALQSGFILAVLVCEQPGDSA
jgi:hypothetical protein